MATTTATTTTGRRYSRGPIGERRRTSWRALPPEYPKRERALRQGCACGSRVHHRRERTERSRAERSGTVAVPTRARLSVEAPLGTAVRYRLTGGHVTTPPCAAPARRSTTVSAPSALAAPSYAVAPAILSEPSLSSLPLSVSPSPVSPPRPPRLVPLLFLLVSLLLPPPSAHPLLPRNLRRCTRRPPLPITTASARARYLRQLTSRTYVPGVCLIVNCLPMQLHDEAATPCAGT